MGLIGFFFKLVRCTCVCLNASEKQDVMHYLITTCMLILLIYTIMLFFYIAFYAISTLVHIARYR